MAYTKNNNSLIEYLRQFVPYYMARFVEWEMTEPENRIPWDDLCKCDSNYRFSSGENKSQKWCEDTWLPRADVQNAIKQYLKFFRTYDLAKLYRSMYQKALSGDVRAADWVVKFADSTFFNDGEDEINAFLNGVNIPGIKGGGD